VPAEELARATSLTKRFGDLTAVKGASATFRAKEIHAVCGENGAGKSTLLKLVAGMLVPDEGEVRVAGSVLSPHTPREAIGRGVAMVLQHFALVPVFTALENLVLGAEPVAGRGGVLDLATARARAKKVAGELGVELPLDAKVEELGVGDRQRLEIARALFREAKLVILDEPTAVLTKTEVAALYATLRRLAEAGKGIVVVTHKMDEVHAHADTVTVMRRGELLFTRPIDREGDVSAQVDEVTKAIMGAGGQSMHDAPIERAEPKEDTVLALKDVSFGRALGGVSLDLHAGEIVGIAGVEGNGQRELVALLAGDMAPDAGSIVGGPVVVVREDRQTEGLVLDASLRDNILLGELDRFTSKLGILDMGAIEEEAQARIERSGAPKDLDRAARTLSGGNQQKIVMARALGRTHARAVVAAQPTRGVDLGASRDIHDRLRASAAKGAGVIVVSADLDELRALSHRILVLARGKVVAELPPTATDEELGKKMLGAHA
jgi:ABC-type uncharacterized transport system ATPase subunit